MYNDYSQINPNAIRYMKTYQNEDANATAIDSMLANLKILLKKTLLFKKLLNQLTQRKQSFQQNQLNQKVAYINDQTKNLPLIFDKTIPPDKRYIFLNLRMTNLFYMRMIKQISCYQKIIPSFTEILPKLEQCYSQQVRSENFSIMELYLLCENKFIQEIKMIKNRVMQLLKDQNGSFLMNQDNLQRSLIQKKIGLSKASSFEQKSQDSIGVQNSVFNLNVNNQVKDNLATNQCEDKHSVRKCYKTIDQVIQNASKSQLFLDFKYKTNQIIDKIYSPLDIQTVDIITFFIPTLMPQDNIDFIYHKVKVRSKKTRKQIRQFHTEYTLFAVRKDQNNKRKLKREQSIKKIGSIIIKEQKHPLKIVHRGSAQVQPEKVKLLEIRKSSLNVQILKPITAKNNTFQRDKTMSRFRQRFQENIEQSKQPSPKLMKLNNLNPLIVNEQKISLSIKPKKKKILDQSTISSKEKENRSLNELQPLKKTNSMTKTQKKQPKISRFVQKRGKSLKNKSNKEIISKKLKL